MNGDGDGCKYDGSASERYRREASFVVAVFGQKKVNAKMSNFGVTDYFLCVRKSQQHSVPVLQPVPPPSRSTLKRAS